MQVLCWIYNALDIIAYHYDPYAFRGRVVECNPGGGSGVAPEPMMDALYDPYEENSPEEGDGCSVGTGGQGGSEPGCHDEYVYVEVSYDGGLTWVEMWEGWAEVCV